MTVRRFTLRGVPTATLLVLAAALSGCGDAPTSRATPAAVATPAPHTHAVAGDTCFICDPSKREPGRLWCKEHGRYEDRCWECQPQLRDAKRPYCEEHGLYEDECFLCDPSRASGQPKRRPQEVDDEVAGPGETATPEPELFCNEHRVPEHECGICQPQLAGTLPVGESLLIRLASDQSAELAGVSTARPVRADASTSVALLGEIRFDGNRLAEVTALSGGVIAKINADLGQVVEAREVLAVVHSPGVAEAKAAYLAARAELPMLKAAAERQRGLFEDKIGSRGAMERAEAAHRRAEVAARLARRQLLNLGFTKGQLTSTEDARSELLLRAPFRGTVVKRSAVRGEAVDVGVGLFEVADLSEMWVDVSVPEEHATQISVGTPIKVAVRGLEGVITEGQITWVGPLVDERTRMVRARGVVPNAHGLLRHGMFADVTAILGRHPGSLRVPASAISRIDNLPFVFVKTELDLYAARRVEVGSRLPSDEVVVRRGLEADEEVVATGAFAIKSALLASRLGAGCTDD